MKAAAVRYFWVASPHPLYVLVGFALLVVFGGWILHLNPSDVGAAFVPVLLLQLFAASSGFKGHASRGYFDALLVSGRPRHWIALSHWFAAALPGVAAWIAVSMLEIAIAGYEHTVGFRAPGLVAILLVSALSWALTLPLPRLSGGVIWMFVIVAFGATPEGVAYLRTAVVAAPPIDTASEVLSFAGAFAACPFLLLVPSEAGASAVWSVLVTDGVLALVGVICGVLYVASRDYPLVQDA